MKSNYPFLAAFIFLLQSVSFASQNGSIDLYGRVTNPSPQTGTEHAMILVKYDTLLKQDFAGRVCQIITESISTRAATADCFSQINTTEADFQNEVTKKNPRYVYTAELSTEGYTEIKVEDRAQQNPNYIHSLNFKVLEIEKQTALVEKTISTIHSYIDDLPRVGVLLTEIAWYSEMKDQAPSNDAQENLKSFLNPKLKFEVVQSRKNYLFAGSALLGSLAIGKKWYDNNLDLNSQDWDFPNFAESIKAKFRFRANAVTFDDNGWKLNRDHTYAGFSYYMACRSSNFTPLESLACSLAASTAWELFVESREVLAINDEIFTGIGGSILAEAFFQMQCYIAQNGNTIMRNTVGALSKITNGVNNFTSKHFLQSKYPGSYTDNMCSQRRGGKFEIEIGYASIDGTKTEKSLNFFRLYNITTNQKFSDNENFKGISEGLTESELSVALEKLGANTDQKISSQLVMAAYALVKANQDNKEPSFFYIGPSVGLDISDTQSTDSYYGMVHMLGTSSQLSIVSKNQRISARFSVFGDSVMVKSLAVEKFLADNPDKTVLANIRNNLMYHGVGITKKGSISYENDKTTFTFSFLQANTSSIFWRQRTNPTGGEQVNYNVKLRDQLTSAQVQADFKVSKNFKIRVERAWEKQKSTADSAYATQNKSTKNRVSLVYHF